VQETEKTRKKKKTLQGKRKGAIGRSWGGRGKKGGQEPVENRFNTKGLDKKKKQSGCTYRRGTRKPATSPRPGKPCRHANKCRRATPQVVQKRAPQRERNYVSSRSNNEVFKHGENLILKPQVQEETGGVGKVTLVRARGKKRSDPYLWTNYKGKKRHMGGGGEKKGAWGKGVQ